VLHDEPSCRFPGEGQVRLLRHRCVSRWIALGIFTHELSSLQSRTSTLLPSIHTILISACMHLVCTGFTYSMVHWNEVCLRSVYRGLEGESRAGIYTH
jgi:hypothetical protein